MKTPLPSGMTTANLREAVEQCIAQGQLITVSPPDLLAILVALDLRERLDGDVALVARCTRSNAANLMQVYPTNNELIQIYDAAERVLKHEPLPDMSKVPS